MKKIVIIGVTGSIGENSLNVVEQMPGAFELVAMSTHRRVDQLLQHARKFRPSQVAITGAGLTAEQNRAFNALGIEVLTGPDALIHLCEHAEYDLLLNAVVGAIGFLPTLLAIRRGVDVALANKETMVIGGSLITAAAAEKQVKILPIDSEHSAIFQCLMGESVDAVEEILLTGSGGPFRNMPRSQFQDITVEQALKHPNWSMGPKITIDSATMMNKGLEIIEAHWLFGLAVERIRVVVHPQSIIHSMVQFKDGSIKAQLGLPDMRVPIQLAMTYPHRVASSVSRLDFAKCLSMTFEPPDTEKFPCLQLACDALKAGGTAPAVLNAANEAAVGRFLQHSLRFDQIPQAIEEALAAHSICVQPNVETLLQADAWARERVRDRNY